MGPKMFWEPLLQFFSSISITSSSLNLMLEYDRKTQL